MGLSCLVYVLNKTISDGKKIPKWKARSTRMKYIGLSPKHASSVPVVLNPSTDTLTAQCHVVFDDWFATVPATPGEFPDFNSDEWAKMFGDSSYQYPLDYDSLAQLQEEDLDADDSATAERADAHRNLPLSYMKPLAVPSPPRCRGRVFPL